MTLSRITSVAGGFAPDTTPALFTITQTRQHEQHLHAQLAPHRLMHDAGLSVARLALAIAPHADTIWVACGPGNNGGDGLVAARWLQQWGKKAIVTLVTHRGTPPADASAALQAAQQAGITIQAQPPARYDLCIDALLGIGASHQTDEQTQALITQINHHHAPVLAVDLPSGLHADSGQAMPYCVAAHHTLSLLTLKPGLFTAHGRAKSGQIWLDTLQPTHHAQACAELNPPPAHKLRPHDSHKGTQGNVAVAGGASGMIGAALLAARAALHAGAGRVYACILDPHAPAYDTDQPELMLRPLNTLPLDQLTVVAGCGGGAAIAQHLPTLMHEAHKLVLDADGLNQLAMQPDWQNALRNRPPQTTVLTPHPLEAARLLQQDTAEVQADRLAAAQTLAERFACTVVLKGSGTIIASPDTLPRINATGNGRLACAGTGDVLAGIIGARLATASDAHQAASAAVYIHGDIADRWNHPCTLTAQGLYQQLDA